MLLVFVIYSIAVRTALASPVGLPAPHPVHKQYDAELGRVDAMSMIKSDRLTIMGAGLSDPCKYLLRQKIYKKYGIRWTVVGDYVSEGFEEYRTAFNDVMIEHIISVRGENFFPSIDRKIADAERLKCRKMG